MGVSLSLLTLRTAPQNGPPLGVISNAVAICFAVAYLRCCPSNSLMLFVIAFASVRRSRWCHRSLLNDAVGDSKSTCAFEGLGITSNDFYFGSHKYEPIFCVLDVCLVGGSRQRQRGGLSRADGTQGCTCGIVFS